MPSINADVISIWLVMQWGNLKKVTESDSPNLAERIPKIRIPQRFNRELLRTSAMALP